MGKGFARDLHRFFRFTAQPSGGAHGGGDTLKEQKEATQAYSTEKQQEP